MAKKQGNISKDKSFEKSVIKDLESSHLRIKPRVLEIVGVIFLGMGLLFVVLPLLSQRAGLNFPNLSDLPNSVLEIFKNEENNSTDNKADDIQNPSEEDKDQTSTETITQEGEIDTAEKSTREDTASQPSGIEKANSNSSTILSTNIWKATDYTQGDITKGSYEVKLGDTLWEISEAVYGDGSKWRFILEDNKQSIDFLPDGSQALIYAGQFLSIR